MQFEKAISTNNGNLDFGSSEPCQKGWISKKLVPTIKKIVPAVQKVGVIAGKVATVAALL
jgi:hypothetical protein